jgi:hypothetical protein
MQKRTQRMLKGWQFEKVTSPFYPRKVYLINPFHSHRLLNPIEVKNF